MTNSKVTIFRRLASPSYLNLRIDQWAGPGYVSKLYGVVSRVDPGVLVILTLPWLLLCAGVTWTLSGVGAPYIDPWFYFGLFLDLPGYFRNFPPNYPGSRLSWILPGHVAYKLLPPLTAAYLLHMSFYYIAVLSLYLILKQTVGKRAALVSAVFTGLYCYFLHALGWDYVDGAGITYFLLTMLALTHATGHRHQQMWLAAAGAAYAAMIYSQLFLVVFTLPLIVYYLLANPTHPRDWLLNATLFVILGFIGVTALFSAINYRLDGNLFFWKPSLQFASKFLRQPNPWHTSVSLWANSAIWLTLPTLTFLSSVGFLSFIRKHRSDPKVRFQILFQIYFLLCGLILLAFQIAGQHPLQAFFYASYLIPPMFLAICSQLSPLLDRPNRWLFVALLLGGIGILLATYFFPVQWQLAQWLFDHALSFPVALILIEDIILLVAQVSPRTWALFHLILTYAFLSVVNAIFPLGQYAWRDASIQKNSFSAVVQSVRAIRIIDTRRDLLFWYNLKEPNGWVYRSVASTYFWAYALVNERFPSLERGQDSYHSPGLFASVVILSSQKDAFQKAAEALKQIGFKAELTAERVIHQGPITFEMIFIRVENEPLTDQLRLTADGWPESIRLPWQPRKDQEFSFAEGARRLFSSDMDTTGGWFLGLYGVSGGLKIEADGLALGDKCGLFYSGDKRDHMASPFVGRASGPNLMFFSIWVKALQDREFPRVSVEDEHFATVAEARELLSRADGWVLLGNWSEVRTQQKLRLVVVQPPGTASLLDKALLVEFHNPPPIQ